MAMVAGYRLQAAGIPSAVAVIPSEARNLLVCHAVENSVHKSRSFVANAPQDDSKRDAPQDDSKRDAPQDAGCVSLVRRR
jgi:hypothetical protein